MVANSVIWDNGPDALMGSFDVTYTNVQSAALGPGNLNAAPVFKDDPGGDYRLAAGSPGIDAGNNALVPVGVTTDLNGDPRIIDDPQTPDCPAPCLHPAVVDMGAFEFQPCPGDVDASGVVDVDDLLAVLAAWGPNPGHPADQDGDDVVSVNDFLIALAGWGPCQ